MPPQVEQIADGSMGGDECLGLPYRLESPHPSLSHPGRLMGLLSPIILILLSTVDCLGDQFTMCYAITAQFIGNDLPRLTAMASQ